MESCTCIHSFYSHDPHLNRLRSHENIRFFLDQGPYSQIILRLKVAPNLMIKEKHLKLMGVAVLNSEIVGVSVFSAKTAKCVKS